MDPSHHTASPPRDLTPEQEYADVLDECTRRLYEMLRVIAEAVKTNAAFFKPMEPIKGLVSKQRTPEHEQQSRSKRPRLARNRANVPLTSSLFSFCTCCVSLLSGSEMSGRVLHVSALDFFGDPCRSRLRLQG